MKPLSPLLSLLLIIVVLSSCNRSRRELWPSLSPEAEEVCRGLENLYLSDQTTHKGSELMRQLDSLTVAEKDPSRRARVLYWKSMTAKAVSDSAEIWLHQARELTDSNKYPYMHARIVIEDKDFDRESYLNRYSELRKSLLYFNKVGDKMLELFNYRVLSSFYLRIGDYDGFRECAEAADALCKDMKKDSLTAKNQINFVMSYTNSGDTAKAKEILTDLLENQYIRSDSDFMGRLYVNLSNLTSDPEYYRKAIEISPTFRTTPHLRQTLEFAMMKTYEAKGDVNRADSMLIWLLPIVNEEGDYEAKGIVHAMLSRQARQRGDYKLALQESETSQRYFDSTYSSDDRIKITQTTFKDEIAKQEAARKRERQLSQTRLYASIGMLVLCCLVIWFYYKGRHNRLLARQYASEAEVAKLNLNLEKEKRTIAAMGLAMTERDNLIKDFMKITDQMHTEGAISSDAKTTIERMVKMSQLSQQDWDNFQIAYTRVHPHFLKRLKGKYPGLSEGDIRLALYICAGLTSKQIAQAMHLQPDSVKKNRQRLRQRMQISSEVSLEEELRQLL